ncbi:MAG: class I poly(R)-hydroxyalkanoic acid synthase [Maricaulaceae bacterium]|jgi:polyhydroxyalkanoate synthase
MGSKSDKNETGSAASEEGRAFGMDPQALEAFERISKEFARAAAASQTVLAHTASSAKTPDVNADPFKVQEPSAQMWGRFAADPVAVAQAQMRLWEGYMNLWGAAARRASGETPEPVVAPRAGDKRWRSEDWSENPVLDVIKQSYLLTARWLEDTVNGIEGVDDDTRRRVSFFTRQLADAFAPTNFPLINPDVMKATVDSGGENFVRGMRQLAEDFERGKGRLSISQTDFEKFKVGENVATSPGQVVYRNEIFELIQYAPTTEEVYERPLLIAPPWINKFYILDLREENSMIRWLTEQGFSVFLMSWVNPGPELKDATFADYMRRGIFEAVDATIRQTGADKVNMVGYCIGGTLLLTTLAYMSQTKDDRIASATFFAAQADFSNAGELKMFVSDEWLEEIERRIDENGGVLDGQTMSDVFNMLRANDLVWSFVVNNYLLGKTPRPFDLLFWNSDQTRLPKALHMFYLRNYYRDNAFSEGKLELLDRTLALKDVETPCYFQASREDHISPFISVYRTAQGVSGKTRFVLSGSGHIAGVINHPDAKKYQHWTNPAAELPSTPEAWLEGASETPGSWWPDWKKWLARRSGEKVPARDPEAGPLKAIEPAPGSYVKVRS